MSTYLFNDIYENLVVKCVVSNLFSLLGSYSSSSVDASSFGCVVISCMYLKLNFVTPSVTVGTYKSVRRTVLKIHSTEHLLLPGGLYFDISVIFQCLIY
jgi:hypothetical protein